MYILREPLSRRKNEPFGASACQPISLQAAARSTHSAFFRIDHFAPGHTFDRLIALPLLHLDCFKQRDKQMVLVKVDRFDHRGFA